MNDSSPAPPCSLTFRVTCPHVGLDESVWVVGDATQLGELLSSPLQPCARFRTTWAVHFGGPIWRRRLAGCRWRSARDKRRLVCLLRAGVRDDASSPSHSRLCNPPLSGQLPNVLHGKACSSSVSSPAALQICRSVIRCEWYAGRGKSRGGPLLCSSVNCSVHLSGIAALRKHPRLASRAASRSAFCLKGSLSLFFHSLPAAYHALQAKNCSSRIPSTCSLQQRVAAFVTFFRRALMLPARQSVLPGLAVWRSPSCDLLQT